MHAREKAVSQVPIISNHMNKHHLRPQLPAGRSWQAFAGNPDPRRWTGNPGGEEAAESPLVEPPSPSNATAFYAVNWSPVTHNRS